MKLNLAVSLLLWKPLVMAPKYSKQRTLHLDLLAVDSEHFQKDLNSMSLYCTIEGYIKA